MRPVLSVEQYLDELLALVEPLPGESCRLDAALGRTLATSVASRGAVPAFDNSAMDGFAVRHDDLRPGAVLREVAEVAAGSGADPRFGAGECVRIMTGAPVPTDAEAVIPRELVTELPGGVRIDEVPAGGTHIRRAGEDLAPGQRVLDAGHLLDPAAIGLVAACGLAEVTVSRRPRVAVAATGDELVAPGGQLGRGQIFESNGRHLAASLARDGAEVLRLGVLPDDPDAFARGLDATGDVDLIVLAGGVSVGDHDVARIVLTERAGGQFRHVRMQPGKPQGFAHWRATPVVALPGNPMSAAISYEMFVRALIGRMLGRAERPWLSAVTAAGWPSPAGRRQLVPVTTSITDAGQLTVQPTHRRGSASHLVSALALADSLAMVPEDITEVHPGDRLLVRGLA